MKLTFLCLASFFKGERFIQACKEAGCKVYLVTGENLKDEPWPDDYIEEIFYVPQNAEDQWNLKDVVGGLAHLLRKTKIDSIVALDDFDVEKAAYLREHFRISGMGQTTARYFRDKLAMRIKAAEAGINVPAFSPLFHDADIRQFCQTVAPPWVVKPRGEASATGIKKVYSTDELFQVLYNLGEERHEYLVEKFAPGDVYHVDALSQNGDIIFSRVSQYLSTPFEVAHGGGIFRSVTVEFDSEDDQALQVETARVMKAFGMRYSASHTEFIKSKEDGKFYFLETASRVGGAHLADMVEASSGINLWAEWAKLEVAQVKKEQYQLPIIRNDYAGIIVSLIRFQDPDYTSFTDAEICWTLKMDFHIGLITQSPKRERVLELLEQYANKIAQNFHASAPAPDKSTH